jgi:hypothetical protein
MEKLGAFSKMVFDILFGFREEDAKNPRLSKSTGAVDFTSETN